MEILNARALFPSFSARIFFMQVSKPVKESRSQKMYVWLFKSTSGVSGLSGNSSSSGRLIAMRFRIETGSNTASWKWVTGTNKETSVRSRADLPFPLLHLTVWVTPGAHLVSGQFNFTQTKWPAKALLIGRFQIISEMTNCGLISLLTHLIQGVVGVDCIGPLNLWDKCSWRVVGKEVFWMALSWSSLLNFSTEQEEARV